MRNKVAVVVLASFIALGIAAASSAAQSKLELTPQVGYQWGGTQEYIGSGLYPFGGSIHANANITYGGTLGAEVRPGYHAEISYHYQSTDLINRPNNSPNKKIGTLTTQYVLLQGRREQPSASKTTPFVLGGLGTAIYNSGGTSSWLFAFTAGAGADVAMNPKVGLRIQARALLPVQWFGGGVYFGSGGSGVSVSGGTTLIQGDASLGLTFKLGG